MRKSETFSTVTQINISSHQKPAPYTRQPSNHHFFLIADCLPQIWESEKKECGPFCLHHNFWSPGREFWPLQRVSNSDSVVFTHESFLEWKRAIQCSASTKVITIDVNYFFWKRKLTAVFLQDDEPPEITYCVVENTGTLTLQALTPTQPMPPQDELDAKFAEFVVS